MIEEDKSSKWLRHRIRYFVRDIFNGEYKSAEEEAAVTLKDHFNAAEVYAAAKRYQHGDGEMPPNYSVSIALHEWAHTGTWLEDYESARYDHPNESKLFLKARAVDRDSFSKWKEAVQAEEKYRNFFIADFDGIDATYANNLILSGALRGDKKSIEDSVKLYEHLLALRDEDPNVTDGTWMKNYFLEIFKRNDIPYNDGDLMYF